MNQTHTVQKLNSLTEELNHSFVSDPYSELFNPVDKTDLFMNRTDLVLEFNSLVLVTTVNRPLEGEIISK